MARPAVLVPLALAVALTTTTPAHAINTRTLIAPLGEAAGDQLGISVSGAGDVNGDGYADVIVGALSNDAAGSIAGRAYVYFGGPAADAVADLTLTGEAAGDQLGVSVSGAGDVNGDGYADVIVGANSNDAGGSTAGRAYVYFGGPAADAVADLTLTGEAEDQLGVSVSGAGDVNGDGYADVIVGANGNDAGGSIAGRAYVYFGGPAADAVADLTLTGEAAVDQLGISVSGAGDVNGDGYADVIVGAIGNDAGGSNAGRAYVYFGGPAADAVADLTLTGEAASDNFGTSVSGAGDVNGDGYADVIVGAIGNDAGGSNAGRAYVYFGGPAADAVADLTLTGEAASDNFGTSVSGAGDMNGDGFADVIVGADENDTAGSSRGRAYVYYGSSFPNSASDLVFSGEANFDDLGTSVSDAGDLTGDGLDDVIVGAPFNDEAAPGAGKAYVYDAYQYIVTSPNGGETWPVGSLQTIHWLGRDLAQVLLSSDGGATYVVLDDRAGGLGENELQLRVPHTPTRFAMVKIDPISSSLSGQDHSDSLFTIEASVSLLTFTVAAREGGGAELSWSTQPAVGPQGIAGYRLYRENQPIGPALITETSFADLDGAPGSTYRLAAVNGLGEELELGRAVLATSQPLAAWPLPYRGGVMSVSFAAGNALTGGSGHAEVALFDAAGRRVRTLADGVFSPGKHATTWDGRDRKGRRVPGGIYFLNLRIENNSRQMKIVVAP